MSAQQLVYKVGERTHVGRVRKINQDDVWHGQTPLGFFYVVADGMGGHAAGEVASNLVVTILMERCAHSDPNADPMAIIKDSLYTANIEIFKKGAQNPELYGMGSTAVAALIHDGLAYIAHVGDSRAYLMRDGRLYRMTIDHTLVQTLVDSGIMTEEEAKHHPRSHILNSAVGCHPDALVDILPEPIELTGGDVLMLCTDGLHGLIEDDAIAKVLSSDLDAQAMADVLVEMALRAGGTDNVTVQIIKTIGPKEHVRPVPTPVHRPPDPVELEDTKRYVLSVQEKRRNFTIPVWLLLTVSAYTGMALGAYTLYFLITHY